jgi:hypothetical protein
LFLLNSQRIAAIPAVLLPAALPPSSVRCSALALERVSAISQNRPVIIEIKGLKTSHFKESKTAPLDREEIGSMGHVECPQSEPANNDIQLGTRNGVDSGWIHRFENRMLSRSGLMTQISAVSGRDV